jgi:hypothetical protein
VIEESGDDAREEIGRKRTDEAIERLNEVAKIQWLMEQEVFRDFMWRVLTHCRVFASVFDNNYGRMSLMEGSRNVGLWLLKELGEASPDQLFAMQQKATRAASAQAREEREQAAKLRRS